MDLSKFRFLLNRKTVLIILVVLVILFLIFVSLNPSQKKETKEVINKNIPTTTMPLEEEGKEEIISETGELPFDYMLPYEESDFKVIKYLKKNVLLVHPKVDVEKAKISLKKWLDLVEEKPGENVIVWQ